MLWKIIGVAVLLVAGLIAYMAITVDPGAEKAEADYETQHYAREAAEQAKQDADEARKQAARDAEEDAAQASQWGIPIGVFQGAKKIEPDAHDDCIDALKNSARYDVKSDWVPNYQWSTDGTTITITGRDVHLQNGFGAYSAGYTCTWDMKTKAVITVDASG